MPLDQIRARIDDFNYRLSESLATDAAFGRDLVGILDLIRADGYDVLIEVAESGSAVPVATYRATSSLDRTDEPNDRKNLSAADRAVKCTVTAWHSSRTKIRPTDMDLVFRDLVGLVYLHWGERDVLTLLPRLQDAGIASRVLRSVEAAAAQSNRMAVLHTDLDKFKAVNDEFGESVGDAVLKEFAARFRDAFAAFGVVVRTGGEEFSAFLFHENAREIIEKVEELRTRMETTSFDRIGRANTCSIGLKIYADAPAAAARSDIDSLLCGAREAERRAKRDGRNCIRLTSASERALAEIQIPYADLVAATLKARVDLYRARPSCFSSEFGNFVASLLANKIAGGGLESVAGIIDQIVGTFGSTIGVSDALSGNAAGLPVSANLTADEWAAIVAWALLRATFAMGGPLSPHDELSFALRADDLVLEVCRASSVAARFRLPQKVVTDGYIAPVLIGRPWYSSRSAPTDAVCRWIPSEGHRLPSPSILSPCLLLPIGDTAIEVAKDVRHLVAEIVEIDDRPVEGGGLPDFWQSNLARVIRACLRNPNIGFVLAIGASENASHTIDWLRLNRDQWNDHLYSLQRRLSLRPQQLEAFRDRGIAVECVESEATALIVALSAACRRIPVGDFLSRPFIDLDVESRGRRLPLAPPAEVNRLFPTDGLRTRTLSDAYPQAIQLLRSSDTSPQVEPTRRRFREFSCFKLVMTNPFQEFVPDYWVEEASSLQAYYDRNFTNPEGLFGKRLRMSLSDGRSAYEHALQAAVDALKEGRPTRRILLPIIPPVDRFDQPLGLSAVHILPRLRNERWHLDFQWIWRTVEALVGFPFSAYGSINWSREFFNAVRMELLRLAVPTQVELGELTYVALSFHMFLDVGDEEIARAIVLDASG